MDIRDIHVGDLLLLRSDLIEGEAYGIDGIVDEHDDSYEGHWCRAVAPITECGGKVLTVAHIEDDFFITVLGVCYDEEGDEALFAPSMFDCHAEEWFHDTVQIADEDLSDLLG